MILCRECGNSAPSSDGFCSSCGALLDWAGERVENRSGAASAPLTPPPITPPTQRPTVSFTASEQAPATQGSMTQGPMGQGPMTQGSMGQGPATPWVAQPGAGPYVEPGGRLPMPEARRSEPVPVASEPEYTGPYCASCGTRNPGDRQFCRACGSLLRLDSVSAAKRRRWWQRLFRRRTGYEAGERPGGFLDHSNQSPGAQAAPPRKRRRLPRAIKLGKAAPVFVVLGLVGIGLGPARAWVTDHVFTLFGKAKSTLNQHYSNITPVGATGSGEKDHGAGLAVDGLSNTYWACSDHADGVGDTITVTFATPVDIDQIGLLSGADPSSFRASARPHDLTVSGGGTGASGGPATLTFDDTADFQNRAITLRHVTSVTFTVKDSYPGQQKHDLAVREIQFFVRSSS